MGRIQAKLKGVAPPFKKQLVVLRALLAPMKKGEETRKVDLCCGRGFGKTILAIVVAFWMLCRKDQHGLFLEPDWPRVNSVFRKNWKLLVPKFLYKENKNEHLITFINGSTLEYGPRNVTGNKEAMRDKYRGGNYTFVIDDEAAIQFDEEQYTNTLAAVRVLTALNVRFYFTISTPKVGAYKRMITSEGHQLFTGTSYDNPHLPDGYVDGLIKSMSRDQVRREIYAEFVSLEGKIWKEVDLEHAWPEGNVHHGHNRYNNKQPWWLFSDIGSATGAFAVVQKVTDVYHGQSQFEHDNDVWVIVADLCPHQDANAAKAFQKLDQHFGQPAGVVAGADVNTRASTDGRTVAYFARQTWPNVHIYPCDEKVYNKAIQFDVMSYLVCAANGERRLCVAKDFVSLDDRDKRGVLEMFEEDAWPDESKRRPSDFLPKNKEIMVQHIRDALLMGSVQIMSPPEWGHNDNPAK